MKRKLKKFLNITILAIFLWIASATPLLIMDFGSVKEAEAIGDLSQPEVQLEYKRVSGNEGAVKLNLKSNEITDKIHLTHEPATTLIGKYDPFNQILSITLVKIGFANGMIEAKILPVGDYSKPMAIA